MVHTSLRTCNSEYSRLIAGTYQACPADTRSTIRNLIILHFIKRFYESAFIHTFSRPTVPLAYVFRKYVSAASVCPLDGPLG